MTPEREQALRTLVEVWLSHRPVNEWHRMATTDIAIRRAEVIRPGRPGLLDLVAEVNGRLAHLVVGLRSVGDEPHFLRAGDEMALGLLEDDDGLAVCTDALRDAQLAPLALAVLRGVAPRPGPVALGRDDEEATVLDCGDRGDLWVFPWLRDHPHPAVDFLQALDGAGFNHVAAPLVRWTWEGRDLGFIQEPLADRSGGWALAMTSLRDLYALGGRPEAAGLKIPHMGWNQLHWQRPCPVLAGLDNGEWFYFVHSYYVAPEDSGVICGRCDYGIEFTAMIWKDNIMAMQFHPEKSQRAGLKIIENFAKMG